MSGVTLAQLGGSGAVAEVDAERLYRLVGLDPARPDVFLVARRLFGGAPRLAPMCPEASLTRIRGRWRIFVRCDTPPARISWLIGHELAHWWCRYVGLEHFVSERELEAHCDRMGAAMVAPRPAVAAIVRRCPRGRHGQLAVALRTTESLALLRVGEVCRRPTALVTPTRVAIRGEPYAWPHEHGLRTLKAAPVGPPLRKIAICDEPDRYGLVAS